MGSLASVLGKSALARLTAGVVGLFAFVPASAQAGLTVTYNPAGDGDWVLSASYSDYVNKLALVTVTPSGGTPDFVIGDVSAGIADPIPSVCFRVDATIIRCPQSLVGQVNIDLGRGNDTLTAKGLEGLAAFTFRRFLTAQLGAGNDVAEGAPAANRIFGGPGRDMVMGGPFGDKLFGGGQNDFLVGQAGKDLFQCGKGRNDLFNDGPGADLVNVATCERRVHREFVP